MTEEETAIVNGLFPNTRWTLVNALGGEDSSGAELAMEQLCRMYWYPVYVFVRRNGRGAEEAKDLTQDFFVRLIEREDLKRTDQEKGRLRSYLMKSINNMLANEYRRRLTVKRGGGSEPLPLDTVGAEDRYSKEGGRALTPEACFERRWALTVMQNALDRLEEEYVRAGKAELFESLKDYLADAAPYGGYSKIAGALGMSPGAVQVAAHRLRKRYRQCLQVQIAHTVSTPAEVEDELRYIFRIFAR